MTINQTYATWRKSLKTPDDSLFYYHKSLDRILLGLAIFVISSRNLASKLDKAKSLSILHIQVPQLITAWIDEDEEAFEPLFRKVMIVAEGYILGAIGAEKKYPKEKQTIRTMAYLLANACGVGGDMNQKVADNLLDDLSTDGEQIYSDKIADYGKQLLFLTQYHGINIPPYRLNELNGW